MLVKRTVNGVQEVEIICSEDRLCVVFFDARLEQVSDILPDVQNSYQQRSNRSVYCVYGFQNIGRVAIQLPSRDPISRSQLEESPRSARSESAKTFNEQA